MPAVGRHGGAPLHLIAGADTAITNLDLSEVFRFMTFRFRSVSAGAVVMERMGQPQYSWAPMSCTVPRAVPQKSVVTAGWLVPALMQGEVEVSL